jgi:hypothetical protein
MGIETFHCFHGEKNVPNYPQSSIAYFRLWWKQVEPEEGRYDLTRVEELLRQARAHGQDLAMRFMPWFATLGHDSTPEWFKRKATRSFRCRFKHWAGKQKGLTAEEYWAPDFNDPFYLERQEALLRAFGERFNGHPEMAYLDIGGMGNWGEWHTSNTVPPVPMATEANARRLIDAHFRHWDRTPLVFNLHHSIPPGLRHAIGRGAGWRTDGIDSDSVWKHIEPVLREDALRQAWQRGPVTGEPILHDTLQPEVTYRKMLDWHVSSYNAKQHPVPAAAMPHMEQFLRRCGYRLVLRSLRYPRSVARGAVLPVQMSWENIGVAPPYRAHVLAVRLQGPGKPVVLDTDAKLTSWLPGKHDVDARLPLPKDLAAGEHELAIAVLDPHHREPSVKLAIEGRGADGWYALGRVSVRRDS